MVTVPNDLRESVAWALEILVRAFCELSEEELQDAGLLLRYQTLELTAPFLVYIFPFHWASLIALLSVAPLGEDQTG